MRGTGVADMASTWTFFLSCFSRSFCATPKRCSSSTISRPIFGSWMSFDSSRWVPIRMSTLPSVSRFFELPHLLRRAEARHHLDVDREAGETLAEGLQVLVGEDGRRRQHRHLVAAVHRLEGGAHGDLGLAVADVAAEQAVHRALALEVLADGGDGLELVRALLVGEGGLELVQQVGVRRHGRGAGDLALGVELEQLAGHVAHPLLDPRLGLVPRGAAELVEARGHPLDAAVLLHLVDAREGEQQPLARGVGDLHHLGLGGGRRPPPARAPPAAPRPGRRRPRPPSAGPRTGRCRGRRAPRSPPP